ncbi:MAG TPA: hypothetical protein VF099_10390 [Ktedonobacterales bacterium]
MARPERQCCQRLAAVPAANRWQAETLKESAVVGARLAGETPALRKTR